MQTMVRHNSQPETQRWEHVAIARRAQKRRYGHCLQRQWFILLLKHDE
jgi:hypothetical protein